MLSRLDQPWFHHNLDRHLLGYDERHRGPENWERAVQGYLSCLLALVDDGHDVMSESVLPSGDAEAFVERTAHFGPYVILLRCELEVVHERERRRQRDSGYYFVQADEHQAVQAWPLWDSALESTSRTTEDLAEEALAGLVASGFVGRAFAGGDKGPTCQ
jgi:chloramphenicol 3-O-phosphotransferase